VTAPGSGADPEKTAVEAFKDAVAYVVFVGSKPLPFVYAALVAAWTVASLELFKNDLLALLAGTALAVSAALVLLPPLLWVKEQAEDRVGPRPDHCSNWLASAVVSAVMFVLFILLLIREA